MGIVTWTCKRNRCHVASCIYETCSASIADVRVVVSGIVTLYNMRSFVEYKNPEYTVHVSVNLPSFDFVHATKHPVCVEVNDRYARGRIIVALSRVLKINDR